MTGSALVAQRLFDHPDQAVPDKDVRLLHARRDVAVDYDGMVAQWQHGSSIVAQKTDRGDAPVARGRECGDDIRGIAGGGDAQQAIARPAKRRDLPRENLVEAVIIPDAGQRRTVSGEGKPRQRRPVRHEAARKLGGEMLAIRRRSAIAAEHHLRAGGEAACHHGCGLADRAVQPVQRGEQGAVLRQIGQEGRHGGRR